MTLSLMTDCLLVLSGSRVHQSTSWCDWYFLPLTGGIALTTVYALTCCTVMLTTLHPFVLSIIMKDVFEFANIDGGVVTILCGHLSNSWVLVFYQFVTWCRKLLPLLFSCFFTSLSKRKQWKQCGWWHAILSEVAKLLIFYF